MSLLRSAPLHGRLLTPSAPVARRLALRVLVGVPRFHHQHLPSIVRRPLPAGTTSSRNAWTRSRPTWIATSSSARAGKLRRGLQSRPRWRSCTRCRQGPSAPPRPLPCPPPAASIPHPCVLTALSARPGPAPSHIAAHASQPSPPPPAGGEGTRAGSSAGSGGGQPHCSAGGAAAGGGAAGQGGAEAEGGERRAAAVSGRLGCGSDGAVLRQRLGLGCVWRCRRSGSCPAAALHLLTSSPRALPQAGREDSHGARAEGAGAAAAGEDGHCSAAGGV